jgi:hypothetical protein
MADESRSYYQLLGVRPNADVDQLRDAFHTLAKTLHPDAQTSATEGERHLADRRMREVNEAWHVLRDPEQRQAYDQQLAYERERAEVIANARSTPVDPRVLQHEVDFLESARRGGMVVAPADDVVLSPTMAFLLRRGPLIALVLVAAALFIGTAYANNDRETSPDLAPAVTDSIPVGDDGGLGDI